MHKYALVCLCVCVLCSPYLMQRGEMHMRVGVEISEEVARKLRVACAEEGITMSDVLRQLIASWLEERGK